MASQSIDSPKKNVKYEKGVTLIPEDIILQAILPKLPIESVLRFQFVSKSWYNFITHPLFIRLHYSPSKSPNHATFLIFATPNNCSSTSRSRFFTRMPRFIQHDIDYDDHSDHIKVGSICVDRNTKTIEPACFDDTGLGVMIDRVIRKFEDGQLFGVIGVCSGVICMAYGAKVALIWNPFIRELHVVEYSFSHFPSSNQVGINTTTCCIGFGDVKNENGNAVNFKLLTMLHSYQNGRLFSVYSLKTDKWSLVDPPSFEIECIVVRGCAFLNGVLHWLAWSNDTKRSAFVLTFDIVNETFGRIEFPESNEMILVRGWDNFLTVFDGKYLLLAVAAEEAEGTCLTTWVLLDDCNKKQWIRGDKILGPLSIKGGSLLWYWADGNAVISLLPENICFHAQDICSEHKTGFSGVMTCWEYTESLVSPKRISGRK